MEVIEFVAVDGNGYRVAAVELEFDTGVSAERGCLSPGFRAVPHLIYLVHAQHGSRILLPEPLPVAPHHDIDIRFSDYGLEELGCEIGRCITILQLLKYDKALTKPIYGSLSSFVVVRLDIQEVDNDHRKENSNTSC